MKPEKKTRHPKRASRGASSAPASRRKAASRTKAIRPARAARRKPDKVTARTSSVDFGAVHQVILSLTANLQLPEVLNGILDAAFRATSGAEDAHIYLYDAESDRLTFAAALWTDGRQHTPYAPRRNGLTYTVARQRQMLVVSNIQTHPLFADMTHVWHGAIIGLPLRIGQRVVGVMNVAYSRAHEFEESEVQLLSVLAHNAAIAIENARLYESEREQRELAEALREAGSILNESLDFNTVLDRLLEQIARVVPFDSGCVMLVDAASASVRVVRTRGYERFGEDVAAGMAALAVGVTSLAGMRLMAETKQPSLIADTTASTDWVKGRLSAHIRSWIGAPILAHDQSIIGFFSLDKTEPGFYQPKHVERLAAFAGQAGLALQNAKLFEESQRQMQELASLYQTAIVIGSVLDLETLLQRLYAQVQQLLSPDTFAVVFYHPDTEELEVALVVENGEALPRMRVPTAEGGLTAWIVRSGKPLLIGDLETEPTPAPMRVVTIPPARSWLGVPLVARDRIIGAVSVQSFRPHAFGEPDRRLLESLSAQVAVAVENARLFEAERAARAQAEALREVANTLNASIDREQLLELILEQLARVVDYDSASLMLLSGNTLHIVAQKGFRSELQLALPLDFESLPHLRQTFERREPLIISDVEADSRWQRVPGSEYIRCWLGVPLVAKDRVIGLLNLDKDQIGFYTKRDAEFALAFANHAVVAIENARLYQALAKDKQRLELLYHLGQNLSARLDLEQLYAAIHHAAKQLMAAEAFWVVLFDEARDEIESVYMMDKSGRLPPARLPAGRGMSGHVIRTGQPLLVRDLDHHPSPGFELIHFGDAEHVRSVLAVPMRLGEKVIGVLSAQSYQPDSYTLGDQQTLGTLAYQAAIAIENARLFDQTRRAAEEMKAASEVLRSITLASDIDEALPAIAAGLKALTGCERISIALLDEALENVTMAAVLNQEQTQLTRGARFPITATAAATDVLAGRIHFTPDLASETSFPAERILAEAGYRSRINLPLRAGERLIGALNLVWKELNGYSRANLQLLGQIADAVGLAIEKSRLFEAARRRDAILEALAYISERLLMPGDLANVLPGLLAQLGRATGVSRAQVFENHTGSDGALLASLRFEWTAPGQPPQMGDPTLQNQPYAPALERWIEILGAGHPLCGLARDLPAAERAVLEAGGVQSLAIAPIFCEGVWWGHIGFDDCETERAWLAAEIEALKNVAGAIGAALARQRADTAEREQRALAEALRDTAAALNSTLDFEAVLDLILANVGRVVPHDAADIMLADASTRVARVVRSRGYAERGLEEWLLSWRFRLDDIHNLWQMAEVGRPVAVSNTQADPQWIDLPESRWVGSYAGAPIRLQGETIGFINLCSGAAGFFTDEHAQRLQAFADQAAIAIDNAQLYAELSAVYRASAQLISPGGGETGMAEQIALTVTREFACAHCSVALMDESGNELRVLAHAGEVNVSCPPYLSVNGPGLIAAAARSGETIYLPDVSADPRYLAGHPLIRSELVVPLRTGERNVGVLNLESDQLDAFSERTRRIVTAFAEHVALALENAQLLSHLDHARRIAEEANRLKGEFLANTSHELRTPLTGIIGSLSMVLDELCDTRAEEREFVHIAYTAAQRLLHIINDVLDLAKIEAGGIEIQPEAVSLDQLFREVQSLIRVQADEKKLSLEFRPPAPPAPPVWADPDRLRQILMNLIGNAIKFTEHGGVTVIADADSDSMRIHVRDTGIGIPLDKQHHLFQPFVQADGSMTRKYGGTGLGLSISRHLAEMMGGTLTLFSAGEGQGSTFTLTLPLANS